MPEQKSKRLLKAEQIAAEETAKASMRDALDGVKAAIEEFLDGDVEGVTEIRDACEQYENAIIAYVYTKAGKSPS